jgi:hypothetical protein
VEYIWYILYWESNVAVAVERGQHGNLAIREPLEPPSDPKKGAAGAEEWSAQKGARHERMLRANTSGKTERGYSDRLFWTNSLEEGAMWRGVWMPLCFAAGKQTPFCAYELSPCIFIVTDIRNNIGEFEFEQESDLQRTDPACRQRGRHTVTEQQIPDPNSWKESNIWSNVHKVGSTRRHTDWLSAVNLL